MKSKLLLFIVLIFNAFTINAQVNSVAIVGDAAGGWPDPGTIDVHQMTSTDNENWSITQLTLTGGGIKFRANNDWTISWGASTFPSGTGVNYEQNIFCFSGTYDVTFNSITGVFNFIGGPAIPIVKLVGTAVYNPQGIILTTTDLTNFNVPNIQLGTGTAQFEVDGVLKGNLDFPDGVASSNSDLIPVLGNLYTSVTFNTNSNAYNFITPPIYNTIDLVKFNNNTSQVNVTQMATDDGNIYKLFGVMLSNDELRFRENNDLSNSYGNSSWPDGTASFAGANIPANPGTYNAKFNRATLEYNFEALSIAVVGSGIGGWPTGAPGEIDQYVLTTTDGITYSVDGIIFEDGAVKFRANNSWDLNWGGTSFTEMLIPNGPDIPTTAGLNNVIFNRLSRQAVITPNLSNSSFAISTFRVSPNPTNGNWNFTSAKEAIVAIQVVDILGKVVANSNTTSVDASSLTNGIYFAKVSSDSASQIIKVIKN